MKKAERKKQIISVAKELFASEGPDNVCMDDIAKMADISRPAIYQYFRNKTDLKAAVAEAFHKTSLQTVAGTLDSSYSLSDRVSRAILARDGEMLRLTIENQRILPWFLDTSDPAINMSFNRAQRHFTALLRQEMRKEGYEISVCHNLSKVLVASAYGKRLFAQSFEEFEQMLTLSVRFFFENAETTQSELETA